jgi:hypothetical protein
MSAEELQICIGQIRALNTCLNVLLQSVQELDETNKQYVESVFNTLIFLSTEIKKELEFLENLFHEQVGERNIVNDNS